MANAVWVVFWLLVLVIVSFFVAGICSFFYIILYVLVVCIPGLSSVTDLLLQGLQFPHYCAKAMMEGKPLF